MVEDVFDNKYPVPRYPYSQTHAVPRRSTTQNLPPDPVFVHLKYVSLVPRPTQWHMTASVSDPHRGIRKIYHQTLSSEWHTYIFLNTFRDNTCIFR